MKKIDTVLGIVVLATGLFAAGRAGAQVAGSSAAPAKSDSPMCTLEDVYQKLNIQDTDAITPTTGSEKPAKDT